MGVQCVFLFNWTHNFRIFFVVANNIFFTKVRLGRPIVYGLTSLNPYSLYTIKNSSRIIVPCDDFQTKEASSTNAQTSHHPRSSRNTNMTRVVECVIIIPTCVGLYIMKFLEIYFVCVKKKMPKTMAWFRER